MGGLGTAFAVRAGRLQFVDLFIGFTHPFIVEALFIRGQHLKEAEEFARVFLFFIGNVQKDFLRKLVIDGFRKLGIKLDGLIFRSNHEPDGPYQFVMGKHPAFL